VVLLIIYKKIKKKKKKGKWPFWLSPRQIIIIPITNENINYSEKIKKIFEENGYFIEIDYSKNQLPKKIRNAQIKQFNFIFVLGRNEEENNTINLRNREDGDKDIGQMNINDVLIYFSDLIKKFL
jgi:threonyl-tRNA synthetase